MSFSPVVPLTGYTGWLFLQRTLEPQQQAFENSVPVKRATDYFREKIGSIRTADDLVSDRQLLSVALGAFGLDEDIDNTFFIKTILSDGIAEPDALANRLADKRYLSMAKAFGLGDGQIPRTSLSIFTDDIIARYESQQFAQAVGDVNDDMRLALNVGDGLSEILATNRTQDGQWFSVLGNAPLRRVFETALGLPSSIAGIDLDQQLDTFRDRARATFGSDDLSTFADGDRQEDLIRLFLVRSEAAQFQAASAGSAALTLLQSVPRINPPLGGSL